MGLFHPRQLAIGSFCCGPMGCAGVKTCGRLAGYGVLRACRVMKPSGIGADCVCSQGFTGLSLWRGIRVATDF